MFQKMPYKSNIYINYLTQRAQWAIPTIVVLDWPNGARQTRRTLHNKVRVNVLLVQLTLFAGVKKSLNFHLSPGQVKSNFYLSCCYITCLKYIVK